MLHFGSNLLIMVLSVARLWVDCFDYQSNTVILAELILRGRPQPVHKALTQVGAFFMRRSERKPRSGKFKALAVLIACYYKQTRD